MESKLNFHYAAHSYLDEYLQVDKLCIETLAATAESTVKCATLRSMAASYGIDRTLWRNGEALRLEAALDLLLKVPMPTSSQNVAETVVEFSLNLGQKYPRKSRKKHADPQIEPSSQIEPELLSAASKFLWMRFKTPIVIYDSYAFKWVKRVSEPSKIKCYVDYLGAWRKEFSGYKEQISAVCLELVSFKRFTHAEKLTDEQLQLLVQELWFQERVFDLAIVDEEQQFEKMKTGQRKLKKSKLQVFTAG